MVELPDFSIDGAQAIQKEFGDLELAWYANKELLVKITGEAGLANAIISLREKVDLSKYEKLMEESETEDVVILPAIDTNYPRRLLRIEKPPPTLFVLGNIHSLNQKSIAIVGTRQPSVRGIDKTLELAMDLSKKGYTIVSGLAHGIDTQAHIGALDAGGGTVAVLASGVCNPTPPQNRGLAMSIIDQNGAIVSEYGLFAAPAKYTFVQRNRITAGLADAVIVIEGKSDSGTRHTAKAAMNAGIPTFYLTPNDFASKLSELPRLLQKGGAAGIETAEDVVSCLENSKESVKYTQTSLFDDE